MRRSLRKRPACWFLVILLAAGWSPSAAAPSAEQLLQRLDESWGKLRARMSAVMTLSRPGRTASTLELVVDRDGASRMRIEFLTPEKDRGKTIIVLGGRMWLYLPAAGKVTEVPRRASALAGALAFDDLLPERSGEREAEVAELPDAYLLVIAPSGRARQETSRIYFDRGSLLPRRREFLSRSGKLLREAVVEADLTWKGRTLPRRLRITDHARGGNEMVLEIKSVMDLPPDPGNLFDPKSLGSEAGPPPSRDSGGGDTGP